MQYMSYPMSWQTHGDTLPAAVRILLSRLLMWVLVSCWAVPITGRYAPAGGPLVF